MTIALIGGSGLDRLPGLTITAEHLIEDRWGRPSDAVLEGDLAGRRVLFLARHGRSHHLAPHRINYRANLWALKSLGAERIYAFAAVGGITASMTPGRLVLPHQVIDYTSGRETSFLDGSEGPVGHIDFTEPYTPGLRQDLLAAAIDAGLDLLPMAVYGVTQGPRLETAAEIERMARDGCDLVGMTGMPEAALARELELPYACCAIVANWAAGRAGNALISMAEIDAVLARGREQVELLLAQLLAGG
ncbi:MAG TPA: S-methyl-5'-thioinosine phosphorylase [Gammaproteobacteria bacterium]|nr:S-methyl-5'-thioinosine phosphorylase [Gammaproteobacteria bacterium]